MVHFSFEILVRLIQMIHIQTDLQKFIKQNKDLVIVESNSGNDGETQIKLKE